jgi:hypothetical protein
LVLISQTVVQVPIDGEDRGDAMLYANVGALLRFRRLRLQGGREVDLCRASAFGGIELGGLRSPRDAILDGSGDGLPLLFNIGVNDDPARTDRQGEEQDPGHVFIFDYTTLVAASKSRAHAGHNPLGVCHGGTLNPHHAKAHGHLRSGPYAEG